MDRKKEKPFFLKALDLNLSLAVLYIEFVYDLAQFFSQNFSDFQRLSLGAKVSKNMNYSRSCPIFPCILFCKMNEYIFVKKKKNKSYYIKQCGGVVIG